MSSMWWVVIKYDIWSNWYVILYHCIERSDVNVVGFCIACNNNSVYYLVSVTGTTKGILVSATSCFKFESLFW